MCYSFYASFMLVIVSFFSLMFLHLSGTYFYILGHEHREGGELPLPHPARPGADQGNSFFSTRLHYVTFITTEIAVGRLNILGI